MISAISFGEDVPHKLMIRSLSVIGIKPPDGETLSHRAVSG